MGAHTEKALEQSKNIIDWLQPPAWLVVCGGLSLGFDFVTLRHLQAQICRLPQSSGLFV